MKNTNKTTFETINTALATFNQYFTVQDNDINQYARICTTDDFKKDSYKIMKDFAIYYNMNNTCKISVADNTLIDVREFAQYATARTTEKIANYEKSEKTRAVEFTFEISNLINVVAEVLAQRLIQSNKCSEVTFKTEVKKTNRRSNSKKKTA